MRWTLVLFCILLLLHLILYPLSENPASLAWFGNFSQMLALLFGVVTLVFLARRSDKTDFGGWLYLSLGVFVSLLAQTLLTYSELLLKTPSYGTITDFIWIIGFSLMIRGLYSFAIPLASKSELSFWHFIGFLLFLVTLALLVPALKDPNRTLQVKLLDVLYTLLEVWTFQLTALIALKSNRKLPWLLASAALMVLIIGDTIVVYFTNLSHPVYRYLDVTYFVGYSAWWLLAIQSPMSNVQSPKSKTASA
ncbi:MAG: hypothetical protein C5B54_12400 [Acidobacteria bacterium]|nr:MAG: hypothetical protein C5B54_12400 [Acidobacteriota bacterium]